MVQNLGWEFFPYILELIERMSFFQNHKMLNPGQNYYCNGLVLNLKLYKTLKSNWNTSIFALWTLGLCWYQPNWLMASNLNSMSIIFHTFYFLHNSTHCYKQLLVDLELFHCLVRLMRWVMEMWVNTKINLMNLDLAWLLETTRVSWRIQQSLQRHGIILRSLWQFKTRQCSPHAKNGRSWPEYWVLCRPPGHCRYRAGSILGWKFALDGSNGWLGSCSVQENCTPGCTDFTILRVSFNPHS